MAAGRDGGGFVRQVAEGGRALDRFDRLHQVFVEHYGIALSFVWAITIVAATQAPWTRNLRGLIDPTSRPESTLSFLFGIPTLMTLGWLVLLFGSQALRRGRLFRNESLEFGVAGALAFALFCLAISRAVTVLTLGA